jgi:hypothetical protein
MSLEAKKMFAELLRKQLAELDSEILLLTAENNKVVKPVTQTVNIQSEIENMGKSAGWKSYMSTGVVENIEGILDECYYPYVDSIKENYPDIKPYSIIGKYKSNEWSNFKLLTIKKLLNPKDFDLDYDYGDTANGCDEVAWDAGSEIIEELVKKLPPST